MFWVPRLPKVLTVSTSLLRFSFLQNLTGILDVDGEFVRWDIREDQAGVDMYVDIQLIDVSTCEPVPDIYIDFWHGMSLPFNLRRA